MTVAVIAVAYGLAAIAIAWRANSRFRAERRLPMQWFSPDRVTWTAPRAVALGFMPTITIAVLTLYALATRYVPPRRGQEHELGSTALILGAILLGVQATHLALIEWTLRRRRRQSSSPVDRR